MQIQIKHCQGTDKKSRFEDTKWYPQVTLQVTLQVPQQVPLKFPLQVPLQVPQVSPQPPSSLHGGLCRVVSQRSMKLSRVLLC